MTFPQELLSKFYQTTLNEPSNITAAQTTIVVSSGSPMPSTGYFRILIDSEIMLVTARSTNTLTVVRGQEGTTGAIHNDGATVTVVTTAETLERILDDATYNFRNRRALCRMMDKSGNTLTASSFTWVNQGSATVTDDGVGGMYIKGPASGTINSRILVVTAPSTPYRLNIWCQMGPGAQTGTSGTGAWMGPLLRESSTGKFDALVARIGANVAMWRMTNATTFSANIDSGWEFHGDRAWMGIEDDGTTIRGYISHDGVNFINLWDELRTSFMSGGADQVGVVCNVGNSSALTPFHIHGFYIE